MRYSTELDVALRLARAAGKIQLRHFGGSLEKFPKKGRDFATNVDFECEKRIVSGLLRAFDYGVWSEEMGEISSDSPYRWIVDPLDGTLPFARGIDDFGVLISLQYREDIVLSVMHRPAVRESWYAVRGNGAFCNQKKVHVGNVSKLSDAALVIGGVDHVLQTCPKGFGSLLGQVGLKIGMPWQAGFTRVVDGRLDIQIGYASHLWDFAPAKLLMEEAGGVFSDFDGNTSIHKKPGCLSANRRLQKQVLSFLSEGE